MDYISKLQSDYTFFTDMQVFRKRKKPRQRICNNEVQGKIAELDAIFDEIDYGAQVTYD